MFIFEHIRGHWTHAQSMITCRDAWKRDNPGKTSTALCAARPTQEVIDRWDPCRRIVAVGYELYGSQLAVHKHEYLDIQADLQVHKGMQSEACNAIISIIWVLYMYAYYVRSVHAFCRVKIFAFLGGWGETLFFIRGRFLAPQPQIKVFHVRDPPKVQMSLFGLASNSQRQNVFV